MHAMDFNCLSVTVLSAECLYSVTLTISAVSVHLFVFLSVCHKPVL